MYAPGHLGLALVAFSPLGYHLGRRAAGRQLGFGLACVPLAAVGPDVDRLLWVFSHRMLTHTVFAVLVTAAFAALAGVLVGRHVNDDRWGFGATGGLVGGLGAGSHLVGDLITPMGIRPLLPLSGATVTLDLVLARNPTVNAALFGCGLTVLTIALASGYLDLTTREPAAGPRR